MNTRTDIAGFLPRLVVAAVVLALLCPTLATSGEAKSPLAALVDSMPNRDPDGKHTGPPVDVAHKAVLQVLEGGKANVLALVNMLTAPDKGEDYKANYLLHAVATHARRPGAEAERKMVSATLAAALGDGRPVIVKAHLLEELKYVGGEEAIPAVSKLLLHPKLYSDAAQVLVNLKAADPLRAALPKAKGRNRAELVQAAGVLRDAKATAEILNDVQSPDRDMRFTAMAALARIGDAAAVEPLLAAADTKSAYERGVAIENLLVLARRLTETGVKAPAVRICRQLLKTCTAREQVHFRCGAIQALAQAAGADAMDEVLAAMSSKDPVLRAAGAQAAIDMPGAKATERWVARLKSADAAGRIAILDLLARRGDPAAVPAILTAMKAPEAEVRAAAVRAAGAAGDARVVAPLTAALGSKDAGERTAARNALLHVPGAGPTAAIAKAIPAAAATTKVAMLDLVARREGTAHTDVVLACTRDKDKAVQAAAISALGRLVDVKGLSLLTTLLVQAKGGAVRGTAEQALVGACERLRDKGKCVAAVATALDGAQGDARAGLYRVLASIGDRTAFEVVRAGLKDKDARVREAAIRGFTAWGSDAPAPDLLEAAKSAKSEKHYVLAFRGYVQMIEVGRKRPAAATLSMCQAALDAARRPEEKRQALGVIATVRDPKALAMAEACLKDKAVTAEAASAMVKVARAIGGTHRDDAKDAIGRAVAATKSDAVHKQAKEALKFIEQFEDFIAGWMASGPYKGKKTGKVHPPEKPDAKGVKWKPIVATGRQPGVVDLNKLVAHRTNCSAYLKAQVWAPADMEARLEIGTDDGVKVWLNGQVVHNMDVPRSLEINADKVKVALKKGWNELLLKVTQGGGDWSACCRVRAVDGSKLPDLRYKAE